MGSKTRCIMTNMQDIISPCDRHSCLIDDDICQGCKRTIDEIMEWNELSNEQRKNIMQRLENVDGR